MSPILDLQNLTPISLEELGEPKQQEKELDKKEVIEPNFISKIKTKKKEKLPTINYQQNKNDLLLSIKECETLSSISKVSIRKAIKEKEINYTLEDGKYKIALVELLKWCNASTRRKNVFNAQGIGKYVNEWKNII